MLSNTLTITIDGVDHIVKKITEGNNSSEYLLRQPDSEIRFRVRHSVEKQGAGAAANLTNRLDRHNVELTQRVYATGDQPERTYQSYAVIRAFANDDGVRAKVLTEALNGVLMTDGFLDAVIGWES